MKCGVALTPILSVSSSTILPIENHKADLSRCLRLLAMADLRDTPVLTSSKALSSWSVITHIDHAEIERDGNDRVEMKSKTIYLYVNLCQAPTGFLPHNTIE